jgi:hypothetical protein
MVTTGVPLVLDRGTAGAACPAATEGVTLPGPVAQMVMGVPRRAGVPGSFSLKTAVRRGHRRADQGFR